MYACACACACSDALVLVELAKYDLTQRPASVCYVQGKVWLCNIMALWNNMFDQIIPYTLLDMCFRKMFKVMENSTKVL